MNSDNFSVCLYIVYMHFVEKESVRSERDREGKSEREREEKSERDSYREIENFNLLIYLHVVVCFHIFEHVYCFCILFI